MIHQRILTLAIAAILSVSIHGCNCRHGSAATSNGTISQVSTIDALLSGSYDGSMTLGELRRHGNHGIGTFDRLDGEMIMIDGVIHQVRADGKVHQPGDSVTTPFAAVVNFRPGIHLGFNSPRSRQQVLDELDSRIPNKNLMTAIMIKGDFSSVKTRSVPAQNKPYPPLAEVAKTQPVFNLVKVRGTIFGFRLPSYVKGINVPGYHLHFLSENHATGGHILDFELKSGSAAIQICDKFFMILPDDAGFANADLSLDRGAELHKVEN